MLEFRDPSTSAIFLRQILVQLFATPGHTENRELTLNFMVPRSALDDLGAFDRVVSSYPRTKIRYVIVYTRKEQKEEVYAAAWARAKSLSVEEWDVVCQKMPEALKLGMLLKDDPDQ